MASSTAGLFIIVSFFGTGMATVYLLAAAAGLVEATAEENESITPEVTLAFD
jgi:hypothetical protein